MRFAALEGQIFGDLTVLYKSDTDDHGHVYWMCECICGTRILKRTYFLKTAINLNCGCKKRKPGKKAYKPKTVKEKTLSPWLKKAMAQSRMIRKWTYTPKQVTKKINIFCWA